MEANIQRAPLEPNRDVQVLRWSAYQAQRAVQRARSDLLSYLLHISIMTVAAMRCAMSNSKAPPREYLWHGSLMLVAICGAALQLSRRRIYLRVRPVIVTILRLGTAKSPLLTRAALDMVAWAPKVPNLETLSAMVSLLIGDHVLLMSFLAIGLPMAPLPSFLLQVASVWIFGSQNVRVCGTKTMSRGPTKHNLRTINLGLRAMFSLFLPGVDAKSTGLLTDDAVCKVITGTMQTMLGLVLPIWHLACEECVAASRWWRSRQNDIGDARFRVYDWFDRVICRHSALYQYATTVMLSIWVWLTLFLWVSGDITQRMA